MIGPVQVGVRVVDRASKVLWRVRAELFWVSGGVPVAIAQLGPERFQVGEHVGAVRGLGGSVKSLSDLQKLQRRVCKGRCAEWITMLPRYSAESDGPALEVSLLTGEVKACGGVR